MSDNDNSVSDNDNSNEKAIASALLRIASALEGINRVLSDGSVEVTGGVTTYKPYSED